MTNNSSAIFKGDAWKANEITTTERTALSFLTSNGSSLSDDDCRGGGSDGDSLDVVELGDAGSINDGDGAIIVDVDDCEEAADPGTQNLTKQKSSSSDAACRMSVWALRLAVLADSVNNNIQQPNYPFMVLTGGHPEAFPSTAPFDFNGAQFFVPLSNLLAVAIASTLVGSLSDRIGRRPVMLVCVAFGVVGSIAKYFLRYSFWLFCAANFVTGLFGATLAVGMAYASDIATTRKEKDAVIGSLVAIFMLGAAGGGIVSIAMKGLHEPLLVGAGFCAVAAIFGCWYLIEPSRLQAFQDSASEEDEESEEEAPKSLNWSLTGIIISGSLLDNAGSTGFFPFCLTPLMFNTFFTSFVEAGEDPIMSADAFRWIGTIVALMVIPAAAASSELFAKIGAAGGCVLGNLMTGVFTIILLQLSMLPPTTLTYGLYVAIMYVGFPLTVISQLSTGPLLDRVAPADRRGFVQGLNNTVMNFGMAVSPWVFGVVADWIGIVPTVWICVGISFLAAIVNTPLMFVKKLQASQEPLPDYSRSIRGEDKELVADALSGKYVPPSLLWQLGERRMESGHRFLVIPYRCYAEDRSNLADLRRQGSEYLQYSKDTMADFLVDGTLGSEENRRLLAEKLNKARAPEETRKTLARDMGQWFADYMVDAGYQVDDNPVMIKQMILKAFPPIMEDAHVSGDNIEQFTRKLIRVFDQYEEEQSEVCA